MPRSRPVFAVTALFLLSIVGCAGGDATSNDEAAATDDALATDEHKMLYALGAAVATQLEGFDLDEADLAIVQSGLTDKITDQDLAVELEEWGPRIAELAESRQTRLSEKEKARGEAFMAEQEARDGADKLDSGMIFFEVAEGDGATPGPTDTVTIEYEGRFVDGEVFDSSERAGQPGTFALNGVVACFGEGLQRMKVGGKAQLVCPPEVGYGEQGFPPTIPPNATLVFDVELLEVQPAG